MLHYAFIRKLPVQIVMSANKEAVISEKDLSVGFGCTIITSYSEVIHSGNYNDFDSFFKKLQSVWDAKWKEVFSAEPQGTSRVDIIDGSSITLQQHAMHDMS